MAGKLIFFRSPREHYEADATIVWCSDDRFSRVLHAFIEHEGFKHCDIIRRWGGAKALDHPAYEAERVQLFHDIKISIKLNHPKKVILMTHSDCEAYGGLEAFNGDLELEQHQHVANLATASQIIRNNIPTNIKVELIFVDFDGVWGV